MGEVFSTELLRSKSFLLRIAGIESAGSECALKQHPANNLVSATVSITSSTLALLD
jgi:hypothetical protein